MSISGIASVSYLGLSPQDIMDLHRFAKLAPTQCIMQNICLFTTGEANHHLRHFCANPRLTCLSLQNVLLCSCTDKGDVFEELMLVLRDRAQDSSCPALNVSMDAIFKTRHSGHVSFTDTEFTRWIDEPESTWLSDQQDLFTVDTDSEDWETDDEISDNEASNRPRNTEEAHETYRHTSTYRHTTGNIVDFMSSDSDVDSISGDFDQLSYSNSDDSIGFDDLSDLSDTDSLQGARHGLSRTARIRRLRCFERSMRVRSRHTNRLRGPN